MLGVSRSALQAEQLVRDAWNAYRTPVDYGLVRFGLERVAALIAADFPTKIYYVAYRNNAFDTHVYQGDVHARLWTYTSDHIAAFMKDVARLGRGDDVVLMVFSEFGRRVQENTSQGTDHGTAGPAFVIGKPVKGGQYGKVPSLTDLDDGNLNYTTDYRRIYATLDRNLDGTRATPRACCAEISSRCPCSMREERAAHSRIVGAACGWAAVRFQVSVPPQQECKAFQGGHHAAFARAHRMRTRACSAGRGRDRRSGREGPLPPAGIPQ